MPRINVSTHIPASRDRVWQDIANLEDHVEWMADAHSIEFLTESHSGVGTRMEVETRFGPLRTTDVREITRWDAGERMAVTHQGLFTGQGAFTLEAEDGGTRFSWTEDIRFPWFFGGPIGAWAARPIFYLVWRRNLKRLRSRFSAR
jgi:carbon monoxide dehydrogenase subunit G